MKNLCNSVKNLTLQCDLEDDLTHTQNDVNQYIDNMLTIDYLNNLEKSIILFNYDYTFSEDIPPFIDWLLNKI